MVTGMSGWSKISRMFWQSDFVHVAFGPTRSNAHAPSRPKASCRSEHVSAEVHITFLTETAGFFSFTHDGTVTMKAYL